MAGFAVLRDAVCRFRKTATTAVLSDLHLLSDMDDLLKALVLADYEIVYLVDYGKNQYRKVLAKPSVDSQYPDNGELGDAACRTYLESILPEDREKLVGETRPEHIARMMKENGKTVVFYRQLTVAGTTLYRKMVVIAHPDGAGYIFAVQDMTEEMKQRLESTRDLRLKEEGIRFIVENMCENFTIVDTKTHYCTTYTHNDRIVCKNDFDEQILWFAENLVVPEERVNYRRCFHVDSLMAKIAEEGGVCRTSWTVDYDNDRHTIAITSTMIVDPENGTGSPFLFLCAQDVTYAKRMEETNRKLLFHNQHDKLTGLMNRFTTEKQVRDHLHTVLPGTGHTFLLIDIDHFKSINDRYGHLTGDDVLHFMGQSMKQVFRSEDILCRWGGDEFVVFVRGSADEKIMRDRLDILRRKIGTFRHHGIPLDITLSIGGVCIRSGTTLNRLFRLADEALYEVKNHDRDGISFRHVF